MVSTRTRLPASRPSAGASASAVGHRHGVAEPVTGGVGQLGRVHEQFGAAIGVRQGEAQGEGGERYVAAADVQQPIDRGGIGDHRGIQFFPAQQSGDLFALFRGTPAGMFQRVRNGGGERWRRPVGPDGIDRVARHRAHGEAGFGVARQRILADQQRIVADLCSCGRIGGQPRGRRLFGDVPPLPQGRIGLGLKLQHIAPIGEDRSLGRQHRRHAGAAGEAGEPGEALGRSRYVFAEVLVRSRNDEAIQLLARQFPAQRGQPGGYWVAHVRPPLFEPMHIFIPY